MTDLSTDLDWLLDEFDDLTHIADHDRSTSKADSKSFAANVERARDIVARAKTGLQRDPNDGFYLIWSEEHGAWWRPARRGYTTSIKDAGRYLHSTAMEIARDANQWGTFHEIAIPCPKGIPS